jgi:prevent-host-death family protein
VQFSWSLQAGPVFLAQHSKPAAVLVSVEDWTATAKELARLQRIIEADRQFAEVDAGKFLTQEQLDAQLAGG